MSERFPATGVARQAFPRDIKIPAKVSRALNESSRLFLIAYAKGGYMWQVGARWAQLRGSSYGDLGTARVRQVAHQAADRKLRMVRRELEEIGDVETFYEILGLGMNKIAKALSEGMEATVVKPMLGRETKMVTVHNEEGKPIHKMVEEPKLVEAGPYIDHPTRIEAAMNAARLRGEIRRPPSSDADVQADVKPVTFVFNIQAPTQMVISG